MLKRITIPMIVLLLSGCAQSPVMKGKKLTEQGQYSQAIDLFYKQIAANPQDQNAWRELGYAFYKSGDLIKAEDALKKADKTDA